MWQHFVLESSIVHYEGMIGVLQWNVEDILLLAPDYHTTDCMGYAKNQPSASSFHSINKNFSLFWILLSLQYLQIKQVGKDKTY